MCGNNYYFRGMTKSSCYDNNNMMEYDIDLALAKRFYGAKNAPLTRVTVLTRGGCTTLTAMDCFHSINTP